MFGARDRKRHEAHLLTILERINHMSASLDALTAEVARDKSVISSAVTLIAGFKAQLDAAIAAAKAGDNSAALDALSADLHGSVDALASAVAENTPAAPAVAPAPAATTPGA